MIEIRQAVEQDAGSIRDVFRSAYGDDYTYPEFYDVEALRRMALAEDNLMLVAEAEDGRVVGTASVLYEVGALTDLVGEFGRLAVHSDAWGQKIGSRLMEERVRRVRDRLHVGFLEARVTHPFSVDNALRHGFACVGFQPMKVQMGAEREHVTFQVRHFGPALELRRNHPRILPEVHRLAGATMTASSVAPDFTVDESAEAYPPGDGFEIEELTERGYSSLLRIERGRVERREVFGPMRLHYGTFSLRAHHSTYLLVRHGESIAAAVGYTHDRVESVLQIFELIHSDATAIRTAISEVERRARGELGAAAVEIDVSAYAPRMQRTLLELGYLPVAYIPAYAFHRVERFDVIKMMRLLVPLDLDNISLTPPACDIADLVLDGFCRQQLEPKVRPLIDRIDLFAGLSKEQARRLAVACSPVNFAAGDRIFNAAEESAGIHLLLAGEVAVTLPGGTRPVGTVGAGEALGEVSFLTGTPHSAGARAVRDLEALVITRDRFEELVRMRPDIGVALYRNLARGLGEKLRRTDLGR